MKLPEQAEGSSAAVRYWIVLWAVAIPSAAFGVVLFALLNHLRPDQAGVNLLLTLAYGLGTLAFPFSTLFSGHQIAAVLVAMTLFLLVKATLEIHAAMEGAEESAEHRTLASFPAVLAQIAILDIVFSLDSVITAVGLVQLVPVMVIAIVLAVLVMMLAAKAIGDFIDAHPTIKMLALSFLVLVGVALIGEGFGMHIPRGYLYFAMTFSFAVEMLNIRLRRKTVAVVELHKPISEDGER